MVANSLTNLVNTFNKNLSSYKDAKFNYNEHSTRTEFIDPFLELLGWDVRNTKGLNPNLREVIPENYSSNGQRPDYTFNLRGIKKFFGEAKKPLVDIINDKEAAFQARSYGWSAGHAISILTNFEYLIIYDTTNPPNAGDLPNVGLLKKYHFSEYCSKLDEIKSLISRDTVYSGLFDQNFKSLLQTGAQLPIDTYFLSQINNWRLHLSNHIYKNNPNFPLELINEMTQRFINQMIFLRICEDRNLPIYHNLQQTISDPSKIKNELLEVFKEADKKYNSGLFGGNYIIFDIDNQIIIDMIEDLYFPQSPYNFSVIEANLLGEIYELFLSERLSVNTNGEIELTNKNENLNRDVIATPVEVVKLMVKKSLDQLCLDKTPKEIIELHIGDISCGSGVILLEIFDFLINYCINWYKQNEPNHLIEGENNQFFLPFKDKKEILLSCVYGIDIDPNAVEVTKFSLLLKLLENETGPSLGVDKSVLPHLEDNILQGNSLIDFNHLKNKKLTDKELEEIAPLNWNFHNKISKLHAIIGNPPYVSTEDMINILPNLEVDIYKRNYKSAYKQFDKYFLFIERGLNNLHDNGILCYIVPNKFSKIASGEKLRDLITKGQYLSEFIDFGSAQLFKKKHVTTYSSILILDRNTKNKFIFEEVDNLESWWANQEEPNKLKRVLFDNKVIDYDPWVLVSNQLESELIDKLYENSEPLNDVADVFNGIQTSAERPYPIYWFNEKEVIDETDEYFKIDKNSKEYLIEKAILKPYFKPTTKAEQNINSYDLNSTNKWIIFPYDENGVLYDKIAMEKNFPNAWGYLQDNYDRLIPRQITGNKTNRDVPHATDETWYHYGRIQALTSFINRPKLIVGILRHGNPLYLYDNKDMLIASGGTAGYCAIAQNNPNYELEYLQAILNHPAIEWLCSIIGSDFNNDYNARGTFLLKKIPIKKLDFTDQSQKEIHNDIVNKTRQIFEINTNLNQSTLTPGLRNSLLKQKDNLREELVNLVSDLYGINDIMKKLFNKGE